MIYQLKITLKHTEPEITRTILVDQRYDFYILHMIIQGLMNWSSAYYYEFTADGLKILDNNLLDYNVFAISDEITLQEVFHLQNEEITYLYDEKDFWELSIKLENILPRRKQQQYPFCIAGEYNSPPEDCGGIKAFNEYRINYPLLKRDSRFIDYFDENYNPNRFDIDEKNNFLETVASQYYDKFESEFADEGLVSSDFEGYNYDEMESIVTKEFSTQWPIIIKDLPKSWLPKIPILNMIVYVMEKLEKEQQIKLTTRGNFPRQLVQDLYKQGFYQEYTIEHGIIKLSKEEDSMSIHMTHILLEISRFVKKRKNHLSLTKYGKETLKDKKKMLRDLFLTYCNHFNWGYFDGYENELIGRFGFGYSIILISKFGEHPRDNQFYAEKYFKAFPTLDYQKRQKSQQSNYSCYYIRTFERFLHIFGLINIEHLNTDTIITTTDLFNHFFAVLPPMDLTNQPLGLS